MRRWLTPRLDSEQLLQVIVGEFVSHSEVGVSGAAAFDKTHALARYIHVVKASKEKCQRLR